ncbi:MAG TPA: DUF5658 family protein [Steroidobacteraceae bacterium]|jgi:hypothetical protein|nr:DUF5658 family protein [Steroidobacteraceae bacterium]
MREGTAALPPAWGSDRRNRTDRRHRVVWSIFYGSFNPRRRRPARRLNDSRFHPVDWYSAHLLAVSIGILLLSATDAFLTGILLLQGANEVNPIMAVLVYRNVATFAAFKMAMTGVSIVGLVFLSRYRFMRVLRVDLVLYAVLVVYFWLIGYEIWMLHGSSDLPVL